MSGGLFDAVDALLSRPAPVEDLPEPAERRRLRECAEISQSDVAKAVGTNRATVVRWEAGESEPRPPKRQAYIRLLAGLAIRYGTGEPRVWLDRARAADLAPAPPPTDSAPPAAPQPGQGAFTPAAWDRGPDDKPLQDRPLPCERCGRPTPYRSAGRPLHLGGFCTPAPMPVPEPPSDPAAPAARPAADRLTGRLVSRPGRTEDRAEDRAAEPSKYPNGPLAVIDLAASGDALLAHRVDGSRVPVGAATLPELTEWALTAGLGAPRLHKHGKDGDPLVVLTDAAAEFLGLPPMGSDADGHFERRLGRLADSHPVVKSLTQAGWQLTQRGFGPWARVYRTPDGARRSCVQYCVPAWAALTSGGWNVPAGLDAPQLAALLGGYAERVLTPRGSTAVTGLSLMEALRPPTRAVRTETGWASGPVDGSRTRAFDPAPPEAPAEHPVAQDRAPGDVLATEAWDWIRPLEDLAERERNRPFVVGLDVNMAFLAAAGRLTMALSEPVHELNPVFDPKTPGSWKCDFSTAALDPRLPNPFTPDGLPPTGPAWYSTAKVAYAAELGLPVRPSEGWLRHESGPWLDPWHKQLRAAYLATMHNLGVTPDLSGRPEAFLAAMAALGNGDPVELAILHAVKSTAKGGIGKLRERPKGAGYRPGRRWAALERPTWDPLNRALVIDTATVNQHRKMRRHAEATGAYPIAVLADCTVYPADGPSPLDLLRDPDGTLTTAWRLGVSPGHCKHEGTQTMAWALELIADDVNPGRHIKGVDAVAEGE